MNVGCSSHPAPAASAGPGRENPNVKPDDIMKMITCFRAHGLPAFPDPVYDPSDGRWHFSNEQPPLTAQVRQSCASVMPHTTPASPIPTARLNELLAFARCMRSHGSTEWPDPTVDGVFHTAIDTKHDANAQAAATACERYLASSGGKINVEQPNG